MGTIYSYYLVLFAMGVALAVALAALLRRRQQPTPPETAPKLASSSNPGRFAAAPKTISADRGASIHLEKGGSRPDSVLRCTIQTGGPNPDFLDGLVGSYHDGRFLRFLMQNDESDDPRGYWHSWDVPWSELVEVILRKRTTPEVGTDIRQPDGTYAVKGPYLQARLYKIGRGIECRLLDPDGEDHTTGEPYRWLKANLRDKEIRFSQDAQGSTLYGDDGEDQLDAYALYSKSRADRKVDEAASLNALSLSAAEIDAMMSARPSAVRTFFKSQQYADALARNFSRVREKQGSISQAHVDYVNRVVALTYAGAVARRYTEMFFYENFRVSGYPAADDLKAGLSSVVRVMVQRLPDQED